MTRYAQKLFSFFIIKPVNYIFYFAYRFFFENPVFMYAHERHLVDKSFFLQGKNGEGVLLVHGWSSTPYEMRALGKRLNNEGYTVYAPLLSGHGTVPMDLESVTWGNWLRDTKEGYRKLTDVCSKVYVGGMSMGGSLSLELAKTEKNIAGLILMATPYHFYKERIMYVLMLCTQYFIKYQKKRYPLFLGSSPKATRILSYQSYPTQSALESYRIICMARKKLDHITQPILLIQSSSDHLITHDSINRFYNEVHSKKKYKIILHNAYHNFIADEKKQHIFDDIVKFLKKH